jgi:flagellar protein FliO/FliZ
MSLNLFLSEIKLQGLLALQEPAPFAQGSYGDGGGASFFLMLLQTLLALALVCGLAYVLFRLVLPRLQSFGGRSGSMVRVVDRVALDARKSLYVIEVSDKWFLVASSEAGVQLISELDATSAVEAEEALERLRPGFTKERGGEAPPTLADRFARLLMKRK